MAIVVAIIGTPSPLTALAAFQHAWTFGAVCLFVAGLGCLLVGRVDVEKAPALSEAARAVHVGHRAIRGPARLGPTPRTPRAIAVERHEIRPCAAAESAADFLARVPIFSGRRSGAS